MDGSIQESNSNQEMNMSKRPEHLGGEHGFEDGKPVGIQDFPYHEIDGIDLADFTVDAQKMGNLFGWLITPDRECGIALNRQIHARALVMVWCVRPDMLGNPTLTKLAKLNRWPKQKLSKLAVSFRQRFGFVSRGMKSETAREAYKDRFRDGLLPRHTSVSNG